MNKDEIKKCGDELFEAMVARTTVAPLTERYADITIEDAYYISLQLLRAHRHWSHLGR